MIQSLLMIATLAAPPSVPVSAAAYSPDGKTLVAGTRGEVHVIDAATGEVNESIKGLVGRITAVVWASTNRFALASGEPGQRGVVSVFDLGKSKPIQQWDAHRDSIFALTFTPDGKTLATAGYDRVIRLWTIGGETSKPTRELRDHSDTVYALSIHPNGKQLASASADRAVKVWNIETGQRLYTLGDNTDWVYAVAWSPDGSRLAAAGVDKSLRVWKADAAGGMLEQSAFAHGGPIVRLAYAGDGKTLATAGEDRLVKIWDAATLREKATFAAQPDAILALAVRPDGKQIAVGRYDGKLTLLDGAIGKEQFAPIPVVPQPPRIASISPSYLPRGKTTRVQLTGRGLNLATALVGAGVTAKIVKDSASPTSLTVELTVAANVPLGPVEIKLQSAIGESKPIAVTIERFPALAMKGNIDSFSTGMAVPLGSTVTGTLARAGAIDFLRFEAQAGQQIGIAAQAKFDAHLSLFSPDGTLIQEALGPMGFVCPEAGRYGLAIRDRSYRGGAELTYRISIGTIPIVTSVFPLAVPKGKTTTVHLSGVNLSTDGLGRSHSLTIPADESRAKIDILDQIQWDDRPLGQASVAVESIPSTVANGLDANLAVTSGAVDGILSSAGSTITVQFAAQKGVPLLVEGLARRYGSPVDPQIEILDLSGKPVPRATLRCLAKTVLTFRDHDSTKPGLRLETWNELAANDLILIDNELIKIRNLPGHPDADCDFFAVNGARTTFLDTTATHHAFNANMYKVEVHPPDADLPPNGMPIVRLDYRNDDGGPGYGKDAKLFFTAPADGVYRIRVSDTRGFGGPNHAVRVVVRPPMPDIKAKLTPDAPKVRKGGTIPVGVSIDRIDGFDGPVTVSLADLPPGVTSPTGRIDAGFHTTTLGLSATTDAKAETKPIKLVAKYSLNGKPVTREVLGKPISLIESGDIVTTLKSKSLSIKPGAETRFTVAVERKNGFTGRIPIDVRGLPHGVLVQNIGLNAIMITEKETEREIVLRAEPWVEPVAVPLVVVARQESKNSEYAATPIVLTVNPK
jgi:hypothetical protein